jgi:hypothetical protein
LPSNVAASVKHDDALIEKVAGGVVLDNTHYPTDKLHEGRQIAKNAEDCRNG